MARHFNTAGPCLPAQHYMLPPERRIPGVRDLIDEQGYFVLHAPRQVGKTTALLSLAQSLTHEGRYAAVLVSMEVGAAFSNDPGVAEAAILGAWRASIEHWLPRELHPPPWPAADPGQRISAALTAWALACPRPLVVFLDEIDALRDDALISVLRQLRDGFPRRPRGFPWSLALIGLRDVRDYKVAAGGSDHLGTASPFNVKSESLTLRDFTEAEVSELYGQHTADTGQRFEVAACARAFELTCGQPWLVNAMARQIVRVLCPDPTTTITVDHVDRARALLIERQDTHLDSLADRLRDPRVRAVIEPMLAGTTPGTLPADDIRFVIDLGLVRQTEEGGLDVANPIYGEVIVRELAVPSRAALPQIAPTWLTPEGRIDFVSLRAAFIAFWLQHGEALLVTAPYAEVAPHLVLMAFLHRVVNGRGMIDREYAIGRGRLDLRVQYGPDQLGIEVKTWRDQDKQKDPVGQGLEQLDAYLARIDATSGWLVLFDQRASSPPLPERQHVEEVTTRSGRQVSVLRL